MTGAPYVELSVQAGDDPAICSGHKTGTPLPLCDHQHRYIFQSSYERPEKLQSRQAFEITTSVPPTKIAPPGGRARW